MSNQTTQDIHRHPCPGDAVTYPTNRVRALMDDPSQVAATVEDLVHAGFERDDIVVLAGSQGAECLDVTGRRHGQRGRIRRWIERIGDEFEELEAAGRHLSGGGLLVMVPADDDHKSAAARILRAHGGGRMVHFGKAHWTPLG